MTKTNIDRLIDIMAALRNPETGCPWDKEQTFKSIAPYTIEEAYEVADAIEQDDMDSLRDELGDLLFQVIFYAQMSRETGGFEFDDVARGICDKMERRHPHVFGDAQIGDSAAQTEAWEKHKATERSGERAKKGADEGPESILDGVAMALPALMRAFKLQRRAAQVGFEWNDPSGALAKVREEVAEVEAEMDQNGSKERLEEEIGDLFFAVVNLARMLKVKPEEALRAANAKFETRFHGIEARLATLGKSPAESDLAEMDALWNEIKAKD
jgi:nucleoside triphosphate diphosphatase